MTYKSRKLKSYFCFFVFIFLFLFFFEQSQPHRKSFPKSLSKLIVTLILIFFFAFCFFTFAVFCCFGSATHWLLLFFLLPLFVCHLSFVLCDVFYYFMMFMIIYDIFCFTVHISSFHHFPNNFVTFHFEDTILANQRKKRKIPLRNFQDILCFVFIFVLCTHLILKYLKQNKIKQKKSAEWIIDY